MSDETAVVVGEATGSATLYRTDEPEAVIERATAQANALAKVIREKGLTSRIGDREYVRIEGWTLAGTMLGVFPSTIWSRPLDDGSGWEARVEARTRAGDVVGAAEASCSRDERSWENRAEYALRSMAQTRAAAKALRMSLGFVMALAGYETTPAEEITEEALSGPPPRARARREPVPPQPRQAPRPAWAARLQEEMRDAQVSLDDIGAYLGTPATNGAIEAWFSANPGAQPDDLVTAVVQWQSGAAAAAPEEAEAAPATVQG